MSGKHLYRSLFGAAFMAAVLVGATPAAPAFAEENGTSAAEDEGGDNALMRGIFGFNEMVDTMLLRPMATAYKSFLPPPMQEGAHNIVQNLKTPVYFVNDVLQGEMDRAGITLQRGLINSTVGILGSRDKAAEMGLEAHKEDFGQTLASWGMEEGEYIVLPIIGPSNPRDAIGTAVDFLLSPLPTAPVETVQTRAEKKEEIDHLLHETVDPYSAVRSAYRQNRNFEIKNGDVPSEETPMPDMKVDPD